MDLPRVTIVGAGQVGATAAHLIALKGLAHITLIDVVEGLAAGKALDLSQSAPIEGFPVSVKGTSDFNALAASQLIVVTAGLPRKPGMSRDDLLAANANIIGPIAEKIGQLAPEAILIVVTNPLDVMVSLARKRSGFPKNRVMGMAGVLDSARLRAFIAERLKVSASDVQAMVLGSHGDLMVPLRDSIIVKGEPVSSQIPAAELEQILDRTKNGGAEIVALLKQGSAFFASASGVVEMVQAILKNTGSILPACVYLEGEYGLQDVCIGVPVRLGKHGVEHVVELPLSDSERTELAASAEQVRQSVERLAQLQTSQH
ncbi:MAG: malate dehydrogenase [Candidatus Omnitrophica bacterium]|nr:malate dehydrogenase [Candidatus Omnitrophota bacterium]